MLDIAIEDSDSLYRNGMEIFLKELFLNENNQPVKFEVLTKYNATQADVIVKKFVAGSEYTCQSILKYRIKPGLIIGVYEGDKKHEDKKTPLCIKGMVFLHRSESLSVARARIIDAWSESTSTPTILNFKKCLDCKYTTLTSQQYIIAKYILRGNDIIEIARNLDINVKTVSAHKRLIMNKFNLRTDCELIHFLQNFKAQNPQMDL
ncbi:DNA-binding transcriptional activator BglJ [Buttiauxella agrestis]|uniref:DNA-binding transcriptional activator BglJ n=1 Tax=Buttiauxella agrestis TaxID=82977 RepID=A0A381C8R4_9ENTR|nr:helix-turn-helix transcriptional regulator [Buttiauxella agrestis]SUW63739.1 DNA-binding transcriptional activator BglJ [Buttiauxella agrestis]